jgi:Predicted Co/Zn/Cd cation transporters
MVWLDRAGAVVVSLIILHAAWKIIMPSMEQLIDRGAPEDVHMEIMRLASSTQGVMEVHAIRTRHIGSGWQVDLHVLVDPDLTVTEGHRISEEVKQQLIGCISDVVDVVVHLVPYDGEKR